MAVALEGNVVGAYVSKNCISNLRFADDIMHGSWQQRWPTTVSS